MYIKYIYIKSGLKKITWPEMSTSLQNDFLLASLFRSTQINTSRYRCIYENWYFTWGSGDASFKSPLTVVKENDFDFNANSKVAE